MSIPLNKIACIISLLAAIFIPLSLSAQEPETYSWFDKTIGATNTHLFNGVEYIEQHRTLNENHKYFLSNEFIEGTIYYNGQPYFFQPLKYNVYDGVVLIRAKEGLDESLFQLINAKIDGFEIGGHKFINVRPGVDQEVEGFYEVLLENGQMQVLKKHSRYINERRDQKFQYYEFKPEKNDYELHYNSAYYEIGSRRDVIRVFPDLKKEIREIYSSKRALRKSDPDAFITSLFRELSLLKQDRKETEL